MHYDFDDKTRFLVIYQDVTKCVKSISKYTGISERTIRSWVEQIEKGEDIMKVKEGRGRKKKLSGDDFMAIEEEVKEDPYKVSSRQLALEYEVSQSCILSTLHELEFEYRSTKQIPDLSPEHKRLRVEFYERISQDPSQLNRIWFSDEMGCNLQMARRKVWAQEGIYYHETPKWQKVSVWAAFSSIGKTSLEVYDENLDAPLYIKILEKHYFEMSRVNWRLWFFQKDNLPLHSSPAVKAWFESKAINLLKWPPYSPDLSPIENVWGWLKERVKKDNPKTIDELRASLVRNWEILGLEFIQNYIESIYKRIHLCIERQGERLPY